MTTEQAIRQALKESNTPWFQRARLSMFLRSPVVCAFVCHRVEQRLVAEGVISPGQRWEPDGWDWDAILDRLLELIPFLIDLILTIVDLFTEA